MLVALFRRIVGRDERAEVEHRRLSQNLMGMARRNAELDDIASLLQGVIDKAESQAARQNSMQPASSSATSGEFRLDLPAAQKEVVIHERTEGPRKPGSA
jgi:hypothetical protein